MTEARPQPCTFNQQVICLVVSHTTDFGPGIDTWYIDHAYYQSLLKLEILAITLFRTL